jgi:hypothetical protein
MQKTLKAQVSEINGLLAIAKDVPSEHQQVFDARDLTDEQFALLYRMALAVAARKKYMQARGLLSLDDIPLDDRYLFE